MPNGASFQRPPQSQPQPAPPQSPPTKRDLTSWWKQFKKNTRRDEEKEQAAAQPTGIFGVPLSTSIRYANVAISLFDANGRSFTYGYVPIVVAKCGVYLKEKATNVEGIFRLAGAERRIKELQAIFNSPDRYGKGLDWTGYTVHDAANILRRYLNQLPEPIIPLEFYDRFREPLRNHQAQAVGEKENQEEELGTFDPDATIKTYQQLITELPPLNRQLLLYILDLLAVFASKSDINLMTAPNLSAIFQPGLLSHPSHDMSPPEYRLSQDVLIFLIENQDNFLVGMQGTAADEQTIQDVQSGPHSPGKSPTTPTTPKGRTQQLVGRSASSASAGSESIRRYGGVRRNVSVNSKHSRQSNNAPSPVEIAPASPLTPSGNKNGVHRSNTVPSKKSNSPALVSSERFQGSRGAESPSMVGTPVVTSPLTGYPDTPQITEDQERGVDDTLETPSKVSEPSPRRSPGLLPFKGRKGRSPTPTAEVEDSSKAGDVVAAESAAPGGQETSAGTPTRERGLTSFFRSSTAGERDRSEGRRPNKLQKRRPQEGLHAGPGSQASLSGESHPSSPGVAPYSGLDEVSQSNLEPQSSELPMRSVTETLQADTTQEGPPTSVPALDLPSPIEQDSSAATLRPEDATSSTALRDMPQRTSGTTTLRPGQSPRASIGSRSTGNELSATENEDGETGGETKERRHHRWKLSMSSRKQEQKAANGANLSASGLGVSGVADGSTSSVGSLGVPRKSFTDESNQSGSVGQLYAGSDGEDRVAGDKSPEKRGLSGWFRGKIQERKEREAEKERAKSPPPSGHMEQSASKQSLSAAAASEPIAEPLSQNTQTLVDSETDTAMTQSSGVQVDVAGQPLVGST